MKVRHYGDDEGSTDGQEPARKPASGAGGHGAGRKTKTTWSASERPGIETPQPPATARGPRPGKREGMAAALQKHRNGAAPALARAWAEQHQASRWERHPVQPPWETAWQFLTRRDPVSPQDPAGVLGGGGRGQVNGSTRTSCGEERS